MQIDPETLRKYASEIRGTVRDLSQLADDMDQAAFDNISQSDVSLLGLYSAQGMVGKLGPILESMG
jgi:hypothetical protein